MDVYQAIAARKSVRAFLDKDVPDDVLTRILDAARHAPSARNFQEWRFIVVRNPATRQKLAQSVPKRKKR